MASTQFTDQNFEAEVLKSETPVLVDFWAEWCPPCKIISPIVDELATEYSGKIKIGKVYETNLVEENEKMLDVQEQTIKINIKAFGIKTIRIL